MIELVLAVSVLNLLIQIAGHAVAIYQRHKTIELHKKQRVQNQSCVAQNGYASHNATQDKQEKVNFDGK